MIATKIWRLGLVVGPIAAIFTVIFFWTNSPNNLQAFFITLILIGAVITAVHYAEVISAYVGRTFGAIILALSVTVIEVGLIVAIMTSSDIGAASLGRETVFAVIMITCNGIIGFSIVASCLKMAAPTFNSEGSGATLGAIATIATLSFVLPTFTRGSAGPTLTSNQLGFVALVSLGVYFLYLYVLTVRNREHFEDPENLVVVPYAHHPSKKVFRSSIFMLLIALASVIGLAKIISPSIQGLVINAGLPLTSVAVAVALVILAPEGLAAIRSSSRGDLQTGFNLAYGSALASIGLTIPALAIASEILDIELQLGLSATEIVLFVLTMVVSLVTVSSHRVTLFQGGLHIVIFSSFLFLAINP